MSCYLETNRLSFVRGHDQFLPKPLYEATCRNIKINKLPKQKSAKRVNKLCYDTPDFVWRRRQGERARINEEKKNCDYCRDAARRVLP